VESPATSVWSGRRVLVTGHTGFKGSWLSLWLAGHGAQVTGFSDRVPTQPSLYELAKVDQDVESLRGDVADLESLRSTVRDARPSVVFHLAAQPLVRSSYDDPIGTFRTNVMGTSNVLEAVRLAEHPIDAVVVVTTDKCYENRGWDHGYRETDELGGRDPYSASKAAAELVTRSYRDSLLPGDGAPRIVSVRAGNVIGGGDWAQDRLLPDVVRAAGTAEPRVELRNPEAERPWQHVLDCLAGYLTLTERLLGDARLTGAWNFGPAVGRSATVAEVVGLFVERLGHRVDVEVRRDPQRQGALLLPLHVSRSPRRLGWEPRLSLRDAVGLTADWYAAYLRGEDVRTLTRRQIDDYERLPTAEAW
jgi:CDP-glucose 4,6-dehydratase